MEEIILDPIPFDPNLPDLLKTLRIKEDSSNAREFERMLQEARVIARPKAIYRPAYIESRSDNSISLAGVELTSRVLAVNLLEIERAFPFIATCGVELEAWAGVATDLLARFWADAIQEAALFAALEALQLQLTEVYRLDQPSGMNPGSLEDWPLIQQRQLFSLFTSPHASIGVRLNESCLMIPTKSVSGLFFPAETHFESCQLCPRPACRKRRALYDPALFQARYASPEPLSPPHPANLDE